MKIKQIIYLTLALFLLSATGINAQVTIGADRATATNAVLDLDGSAGALLLPRFATTSAFPNNHAELKGAEVYCIADNLVYTCDGTKWVVADTKLSNGAGITVSSTNVISSTFTDTDTKYTAGAAVHVTGTVITADTAKAGTVGVVKTGTVAETHFAVAADGTLSVPVATTSAAGLLTGEEKLLIDILQASKKLSDISANDMGCTTTPSAYGYRIGNVCWAPYDVPAIQTQSADSTRNGVACPAPWRVPSTGEASAFAKDGKGNAEAAGWTRPIDDYYWVTGVANFRGPEAPEYRESLRCYNLIRDTYADAAPFQGGGAARLLEFKLRCVRSV